MISSNKISRCMRKMLRSNIGSKVIRIQRHKIRWLSSRSNPGLSSLWISSHLIRQPTSSPNYNYRRLITRITYVRMMKVRSIPRTTLRQRSSKFSRMTLTRKDQLLHLTLMQTRNHHQRQQMRSILRFSPSAPWITCSTRTAIMTTRKMRTSSARILHR